MEKKKKKKEKKREEKCNAKFVGFLFLSFTKSNQATIASYMS
jgi:hypothetical protein